VYLWAGRFRRVRLSKGDSVFCYPENIRAEMRKLFRTLPRQRFLKELRRVDFATTAAHFLAELNAIHPFREGNGRTQIAFMALVANHAERPLELDRLIPKAFLEAMIASFQGDETPLRDELVRMLE
jgi:cell filamentation protein